MSVWDIVTYNKKKGNIPTFTTSIFILLALVISGQDSLFAGVLGLSLAFVLSDLELWGGWADFKLYVGTCIILSTMTNVLFYTLLLSTIALIYKAIAKKYNTSNIPFIPAICISYAIYIGLLFILHI